MNQFQPNIDFRDVNDFLDYLPEHELVMVEKLRGLIFENIPDCKEKLSYNVPFYYGNSRICFIWPSSVPWGKTRGGGVQFGFCKGYLMPDPFNYLDKGERKQVYTKTLHKVSDINEEMLTLYIGLAWETDKLNKNITQMPFIT